MKHKKVSKKSVNSMTDNPKYNSSSLNNPDGHDNSSMDSSISNANRHSRKIDFDMSMSTRSDSRSSSVSSQGSEAGCDESDEKDGQKQAQQFGGYTAQQMGHILNEYRLSCEVNGNGANILNSLILKAAAAAGGGGGGEEFSKILFSQIANIGK